jgi:hypothetical protein
MQPVVEALAISATTFLKANAYFTTFAGTGFLGPNHGSDQAKDSLGLQLQVQNHGVTGLHGLFYH